MNQSDPNLLVTIAVICAVFYVYSIFANWFRSFLGGGSAGSLFNSNSEEIVLAIQRGPHIEVKRANGLGTIFEGKLNGWSSNSVSFIREDGSSCVYDVNGNFTYYT